MRLSFNWLKQWVSLPTGVAVQDVAHRLTMAGLEVERLQPVCVGLAGVIVVQVVGTKRHPQADKLLVVDVFDGKETTQVVCGAPNVPAPDAAQRIVWAPPGATLPGGITIAAKEVRGVSSPGMLCSAVELGLAERSGGLLLLSPHDGFSTGDSFTEKADLPDWVLELNVTPNRADCLGHVGVARELAALFAGEGASMRTPTPAPKHTLSRSKMPVQVEILDPQACHRYRAAVIQGIQVGPTPLPLQWRLERLGLQPISNIVDATQLAMLEWGHPLHAFDLDKISGGKIVVRSAPDGLRWQGLGGRDLTLSADDLVIADQQGVPLALAGILGGLTAQVEETTKNIVLESAHFDPIRIRRTAKRLKIQTDASYRFERGTDPHEGLQRAAERCIELLLQWAGGTWSQPWIEKEHHPLQTTKLLLSTTRASELLGISLSRQKQETLLKRLGMQVKPAATGDLLHVTVPTYRQDIQQEIDLIEEIGRLVGYDALPALLPPPALAAPSAALGSMREQHNVVETARDCFVSLGFHEVQTLPFSSPQKMQAWVGKDTLQRYQAPLMLENPLREELSALRMRMLPALLDLVASNLAHGQTRIRLFESGETFWPRRKGELPEEKLYIAALLAGHRDGWLKEGDPVDYYDLKGAAEVLLTTLYGSAWSIRTTASQDIPWFHPGVCASIVDAQTGQLLGELGEIHPDLRERLGISLPVFGLELGLPATRPPRNMFSPLPKFPSVTRDLSFFIDEKLSSQSIVDHVLAHRPTLLREVRVREDYREKGKVPVGQKALLLGFVYQADDRTLRDEEVQTEHQVVLGLLQQAFHVQTR